MPEPTAGRAPLKLVTWLFLKLGLTSFGGPAVHIAMMRQEVVDRRRWLTDPEFLDLLGATNLIPGPNSTELAAHLGYRQAGWPGFLLASLSFIGPSALIVLAGAWAYVRFGTTPQVDALFYGVRPILIAVILQALWVLGRTAVKDLLTALVGLASLALVLLGMNGIAVLAAGGLTVLVAKHLHLLRERGALRSLFLSLLSPLGWVFTATAASLAPSFSLLRLFALMLKTGAVLYGSGYVLLAFLHADLVQRLHWLTDQQLLDAVTVGQFTPGPVLTTATFIGYLLGGLPGAALATAGIFLPGLLLVAASQPVLLRLRHSSWARAFLDGVNVTSLALMTAVTWYLGVHAVVDPLTGALAIAGCGLLLSRKVNSAWLMLGAMIIGLLAR